MGDGDDLGFPVAPQVSAESAGRVARPSIVDQAVKTWFIGAGCWLLSAVLGQLLGSPAAMLFYFNSTNVVGQDPQTGATISETQTTVAPTPVVLIIVAIVAVLWGGLIYALRQGGNWARILLTILGILGELSLLFQIISALTGSPNGGAITQGLFGLAAFGFVLAALIIMYQPSASAYFRRRR